MEKMRMESPDIKAQNVDKIAALFPNCITEAKDAQGKLKKAIDFDKLRQMLSNDIAEGESYEFTWVGKKAAMVEANTPIRKTLRPCPEESKDWDNTQNLYIEGDNLDVLKLLQESYLGKVKMIYIDPPYNTGKDSFVYPDNHTMDKDEYEDAIELYDENGNRRFKVNNESEAKFHSAWCSMMYSRLLLARNLLSKDGVIFISIDDNEQENLKKICDEVFGEDNYINTISLRLKNIAGASGGGEDKRLKKNMEFVLVYAKIYDEIIPFNNVYNYYPISKLVEQYRNENISWKYTSALISEGDKEYIGATVDGDGNDIKIYKRNNYIIKSINQIMQEENISEEQAYDRYAYCLFQTAMPQSSIRPRVMKKVNDLGIVNDLCSIEYIPKSGRNKGNVYEQFYKGEKFRLFAWLRDVSEEKDGILCKKELQGTLWDFVNETKNLSKEGNISFPNGKKPISLIYQMLKMIGGNDYIVLDFFSGSASTAHAVMKMNKDDNGQRKFIMIQIPELCGEQSDEFQTISELGKERIRRAGAKIKEEAGLLGEKLDTGFRVLKVADSNMKPVYYEPDKLAQGSLLDLASNIKEDRTALDLLFGCLLEWGVPLDKDYHSEVIDGFTVHFYQGSNYVACFDSNVSETLIEEIAKRDPLHILFRDSCFASAPAKMNMFEICKRLMPAKAADIRRIVTVL